MKDIAKPVVTVLIIDDDEDDRKMFCEAVQVVDEGVTCLAAVDGLEALRLLRTREISLPDFIFLDINMPRMNGKQCLAEIKQTSHLQHIPVIIYTTSKHPRDIEETKNLGAVHFISKPFHFDDICRSITYVLIGKWDTPLPENGAG